MLLNLDISKQVQEIVFPRKNSVTNHGNIFFDANCQGECSKKFESISSRETKFFGAYQ